MSAVKGWLTFFALTALAAPAHAQNGEAFGYMGHLGEWELTATLSSTRSGWTKHLFGPFVLKHVGICTQAGPEEKSGEMHIRISWFSSIVAEVKIESVTCKYSAQLSDAYHGLMLCPHRSPVPLTLWLR